MTNKHRLSPFLIISILLLLSGYCFAQSITWQRYYDGDMASDQAKDICLAPNGNFYVVGSIFVQNAHDFRMYVMKLNPYGDTIWTRIVDTLSTDAVAIAPTTDGGCVFVGEGHFAVKMNPDGTIGWAKNYGGGGISCFDINKTNDGGYIACGSKRSFNGNVIDEGYVMKIDNNGNLVWQKIYTTTSTKDINSIIQINIGYIACGSIADSELDTLKALLLRLDDFGNIIWEKRYKPLNRGAGGGTINLINQTYVIGGGSVNSTGNRLNSFFIRTDTSGNLLYEKVFESNIFDDFYRDMKVINSNRYISLSLRDSGSWGGFGRALITDSIGNILSNKTFQSQVFTDILSIQLLGNGDIIFAGAGNYSVLQPRDMYVVRTDSFLNYPPIGINEEKNLVANNYILNQNYPNPFNPITHISFELKRWGYVTIKIYDILGKLVSNLINRKLQAGKYTENFEAKLFSSGIYFYELNVDNNIIDTKKMIFIK